MSSDFEFYITILASRLSQLQASADNAPSKPVFIRALHLQLRSLNYALHLCHYISPKNTHLTNLCLHSVDHWKWTRSKLTEWAFIVGQIIGKCSSKLRFWLVSDYLFAKLYSNVQSKYKNNSKRNIEIGWSMS